MSCLAAARRSRGEAEMHHDPRHVRHAARSFLLAASGIHAALHSRHGHPAHHPLILDFNIADILGAVAGRSRGVDPWSIRVKLNKLKSTQVRTEGDVALDQSDRELLELLVSTHVRDALSKQRSAVVEDVTTGLLSDPRIASFQAQTQANIEANVEGSLKTRYTWIAIITAALVGGGAAAVTQSFVTTLNTEAAQVLQKHMAEIAAYKDFIATSREDLRKTTQLFEPLKEDIEAGVGMIRSQNAVTQAQQRTAEQTLQLLAETTRSLGQLKTEADQLIAKTGGTPSVSKEQISKLAEEVSRIQSTLAPSRYRVFLHFGNSELGLDLESKIKSGLADRGFIIVGTDRKDDRVGGAGIDYFYDDDCAGADQLRKVLTAVLPQGSTLPPLRKQSVLNQPGTLGVWLASKPPQTAGTSACKTS